jgi:hypothetical protein
VCESEYGHAVAPPSSETYSYQRIKIPIKRILHFLKRELLHKLLKISLKVLCLSEF